MAKIQPKPRPHRWDLQHLKKKWKENKPTMANRRRRAPSASTTSISSNGRRRVSSRLVRAGRRTETGRGRAARSPLLPGEHRRDKTMEKWGKLDSGADIQTPHDRDTKQPAQIGHFILHPVARKFMCQQTKNTHVSYSIPGTKRRSHGHIYKK